MADTAISGWILLCRLLLASVVWANWQFLLAIATIIVSAQRCLQYFLLFRPRRNVYDDDYNSFGTSAVVRHEELLNKGHVFARMWVVLKRVGL